MLILNQPPRYRTYLLRCQQVRSTPDDDEVRWWFRLEDLHSGQRHGFTSFAALVAFLTTELGEGGAASPSERRDPTLASDG